MRVYAKLKTVEEIEMAPRDQPGISNWINDEAAILAAGYLPLASEEPGSESGRTKLQYRVENGFIIPFRVADPETREEIRQRRENLYAINRADILTLEYMRKFILGILSEDEKNRIAAALAEISDHIAMANPYPSEAETENGGENV